MRRLAMRNSRMQFLICAPLCACKMPDFLPTIIGRDHNLVHNINSTQYELYKRKNNLSTKIHKVKKIYEVRKIYKVRKNL